VTSKGTEASQFGYESTLIRVKKSVDTKLVSRLVMNNTRFTRVSSSDLKTVN
jgi:2-phospho-L-lactate transferase/gluconeogenesis factor (CofD/UPF0052 family)